MTTRRLAILCSLYAVLTVSSGAPVRARQTQAPPEPQVVEMTAERFSFTPSEIKAKVNTPVVIRLRSEDTDHGFKIEGTEIDVRIPKRGKGTATVTFEPTREGRFAFECTHVCGAGHSFMRGVIVVSK
jgi:cytochrome c oxidase subunit 2